MAQNTLGTPEYGQPFAEAWARRMDNWRRVRRARNSDPANHAFWNSLHIWEMYERYTNFPGRLLEPVQACVDSRHTVLDIGAGSGSLSLPLARRTRWVTAVEPSAVQCARLKRSQAANAITNISIIQKDWESVGLDEIGHPDLVVASYCLFMPDLVGAISKMRQVARQRVLLVHLAGHDLQDVIRGIRAEEALAPDDQLLLAVLKEMGLDATLSLIPRTFSLPLPLQLDMFRAAQGFTEPEIGKLEKHLKTSARIEFKDGKPWITRTYLDALIGIASGASCL